MGKRKLSGSRNHICGSAGTAAWELPENLEQEMEKGHRVIVIGYTGSGWDHEESLPENRIQPVYAVVLEDTIRKNARKPWISSERKVWMSR